MYPAYYLEHSSAIYSYEAGYGVHMHQEFIKIKNKLNITCMAFFNLGTGDTNSTSSEEICKTDPMASAMCFYVNLNPSDCYKEINIDVSNNTEVNQTLELAKSVNQSFIIQVGDSRSISTFQYVVNPYNEKMGEIFYLTYLTDLKSVATDVVIDPREIEYLKRNILTNFQGYIGINNFLYSVLLPTQLMKEMISENFDQALWKRLSESEFMQVTLKDFGFNSTNIDIKSLISLWRAGLLQTSVETGLMKLILDDDYFMMLMNYWKRSSYIEQIYHINEEEILDQHLNPNFSPSEALKARPFCDEKKPHCKAGLELVHSFYKEDY